MSERIRKGFPITAWAAVNSLGTNTEAVVHALKSGRPGLYGPPANTPFRAVCGRVTEELPALPTALKGYDSRNNQWEVVIARAILLNPA